MLVIIGDKSKAASLSSENLCPKCGNYSRMRYSLDDKTVHLCTALSGPPRKLRGPVAECSDFYNAKDPSLHDLKQIAWDIETSKVRVGFAEEMKVTIQPKKKKKEDEREPW